MSAGTQPDPQRPAEFDRAAMAAGLARFLDEFIRGTRLELRFDIRESAPGAGGEFEQPEILAEFKGPDQDLLLERQGELLLAVEYLALRCLHLPPSQHDRIRLDCAGWRALRLEELKLSAQVAAERVRESKQPFRFNPMPARDRRVIHLALSDVAGVRTASEGAGDHRQVVIYPAK